MLNTTTQIVIIDDHKKETDSSIVNLQLQFPNIKVIVKNKAIEGLDYILNNLDKKTVVFLDYDLGKGSPNGTEILKDIREKTSLVFVIMITANNIDNIPREDLIEYINNDAFAFIPRTINLADYKPIIEKAIHFLDARVDSILEQWILKHEKNDLDEPYLKTTSGETLSLKDILFEIRQQTSFGKEVERNIIMLAIDLLTRNKKQIND